MQAPPDSVASAQNGAPIGPQLSPHAPQQSFTAGQGEPSQEATSPQPQLQPQPQPQDEGAAMLGRIAAVHADVDSLAARVRSCAG